MLVAFGGQTPLNLAAPLAAGGVPLLGSDLEAIDQAEERTRFSALLDRLGIPQPEGGMAHSFEEALTLADRIGYPVIVRPSFVIGGLAIDFCYSPEDLARQLALATVVDPDRPVRIDRYLEGIEVDVDAVSDGRGRVLIPGLLEHVERAGVHSGDSVGLFPPQTVSAGDQGLIVATMERIVLALGARGLVNAQFIVREDGVYLIEVNPRASRTVPFLSKVTGVPMVELAVRIGLGATLAELGWQGGLLAPPDFVAVKAPAFSTAKLRGVDPSVGPFMQSTGEVIGIHRDPRVALAKALRGAALIPPRAVQGDGSAAPSALLSIADRDKEGLPRLAAALRTAGYDLLATPGTRDALMAHGFEAQLVAKLGDDVTTADAPPGILDVIASGTVRLVVNTPTPRSGAVRDAAEIRHAAVAEGILCLTAIETAVAAAEALDPAIEEALAEVRSLTDWVPTGGTARLCRRRDEEGLTEGPERQRRQADHDDRQRHLAEPDIPRRDRALGARVVGCDRMAGPRPDHVAPDDRNELEGPDQARRQPRAGRFEEGRSEVVLALLERIGDRDDDPLAVDDQKREVVGEQVADGDREQPGAGRGDADESGDEERRPDDDRHEREENHRLRQGGGQPEGVDPDLRLREAVEEDRAGSETDHDDVGD